MNKIHLYAAMLLLSCGAALLAAAQPASTPSASWRSLLQDDSAPDWRGWKEPGLPAGWHVAGGGVSQGGPGGGLGTEGSFGGFELEVGWEDRKGWKRGHLLPGPGREHHIYRGAPENQLL